MKCTLLFVSIFVSCSLSGAETLRSPMRVPARNTTPSGTLSTTQRRTKGADLHAQVKQFNICTTMLYQQVHKKQQENDALKLRIEQLEAENRALRANRRAPSPADWADDTTIATPGWHKGW